jgi:hypothetical protein
MYIDVKDKWHAARRRIYFAAVLTPKGKCKVSVKQTSKQDYVDGLPCVSVPPHRTSESKGRGSAPTTLSIDTRINSHL